MNSKQYNNIINHTLVNEPAAQTEDSLTTARAIFNNMGVALPSGDLPEIMEVLQTNEYMGWKACTREEAQQAANNGIAAIGIRADQIVVLAAEDEDEPVAQTASVRTVTDDMETDSENVGHYLFYYINDNSTAYVLGIKITNGCNLYLKPQASSAYYLKNASGGNVTLVPGTTYTLPLLCDSQISVGSTSWYRVLYEGKVVYVKSADCAGPQNMLKPAPAYVRWLEVVTGTLPALRMRSTPYIEEDNVIGYINNLTPIRLMDEVMQNTKWRPVIATLNDGQEAYGWCSDDNLLDYAGIPEEYGDEDAEAARLVRNDAILTRLDQYCENNEARRKTFRSVATALFDARYRPSFVAGILANVQSEGTTGQYEEVSSAYNIRFVNENYIAKDYYRTNLAGQTVMTCGLQHIEEITTMIKQRTEPDFKVGNIYVGCGVGCIQWTADRTEKLLEQYRVQAGANANEITLAQAEEAENAMLLAELSSKFYRQHIKDWAIGCQNDFDSEAAAYAAGFKLCEKYVEAPSGATSRATLSVDIYNVMMGNES